MEGVSDGGLWLSLVGQMISRLYLHLHKFTEEASFRHWLSVSSGVRGRVVFYYKLHRAGY